tara:strand:+ start:63 stop:368 length:306 start_codon:yes stop_codon:yes gene_type:complete
MRGLLVGGLMMLVIGVGSLAEAQEREPREEPAVFIWGTDLGGEEPDWRTREGLANLKRFLDFAEGGGCAGGLMDLKACAIELGLDLESWPWIVLKGKEIDQ